MATRLNINAIPDGSIGANKVSLTSMTEVYETISNKENTLSQSTTKYPTSKAVYDAIAAIPSGSGTVTSVALSVPTGLSVAGSPITTSGTLAVSLASGYVIPTSAKIAEIDAKVPNTRTVNGKALSSDITLSASDVSAIASSLKGANNGVAELDSNGKVPSTQLPSYVDDVLEFNSVSDFPATGEAGKIYVAKDTNKTYRWSGTQYVEISPSIALGETSSTAYRGDRGKTAYDHSQSTHARTDATAVASSTTNGNIKINGTETTVYSHPGTHPASMITGLATVATSGSYNDLSYKPTIPAAANNGVLTIKGNNSSNGTTTFSANQTENQTLNFEAGSNVTITPTAGNIKIAATDTIYTHPSTHPASMITGLATVATSGSYNDLSNKPTIPTVNNATLTIQKNGTSVATFTANASSNVTANITVPTSPSDIGAAAASHTHDDRYYTESEVDSKLSGKADTSHGNHVPTTQTASNSVFLRNDNTWATVTPTNIGAAAASHTHSGYEATSNKVTSVTSGATDTQYPSAKAVYNVLVDYEYVTATALNDLRNKIPLVVSTLSPAASITLNSTSANTYQTCTITSNTSITLAGGNANAGYSHYILFINSGSSDCVITPPSGHYATDSTFTVPAGGALEISYIYNGSKVIFTGSAELSAI